MSGRAARPDWCIVHRAAGTGAGGVCVRTHPAPPLGSARLGRLAAPVPPPHSSACPPTALPPTPLAVDPSALRHPTTESGGADARVRAHACEPSLSLDAPHSTASGPRSTRGRSWPRHASGTARLRQPRPKPSCAALDAAWVLIPAPPSLLFLSASDRVSPSPLHSPSLCPPPESARGSGGVGQAGVAWCWPHRGVGRGEASGPGSLCRRSILHGGLSAAHCEPRADRGRGSQCIATRVRAHVRLLHHRSPAGAALRCFSPSRLLLFPFVCMCVPVCFCLLFAGSYRVCAERDQVCWVPEPHPHPVPGLAHGHVRP